MPRILFNAKIKVAKGRETWTELYGGRRKSRRAAVKEARIAFQADKEALYRGCRVIAVWAVKAARHKTGGCP